MLRDVFAKVENGVVSIGKIDKYSTRKDVAFSHLVVGVASKRGK